MSTTQFSFEFFPPKSANGLTALAATMQELDAFDPTFVSVTYGAGGSTRERTLGSIEALRTATATPVAGHLTCVGQSESRTHEVIDAYTNRGVRRIVALRGDPAADGNMTEDGYRTAAELVAAIRDRRDGALFDISVAAYPETHPLASSATADMANLKDKIDAGADRAITQFFFDTEAFLRFRDRATDAGITLPLVPGVMPITNVAGALNFAKRTGTSIPPWLPSLFEDLDDNPAIRQSVAAAVAVEQCDRLLREGVTDLHIYTMNQPDLTAAVCRVVQSRHIEQGIAA